MAKSSGGSKSSISAEVKLLKEKLALEQSIYAAAKQNIDERKRALDKEKKELEDYKKSKKKFTDDEKAFIKELEDFVKDKEDSYKKETKYQQDVIKNYEQSEKRLKSLEKIQQRKLDLLKEEVDDWDDITTSTQSVGKAVGKNNKVYAQTIQRVETLKGVQSSILKTLDASTDLSTKDREGIVKKLNAQKQFQLSINESIAAEARGEMTRADMLKQIEEAKSRYDSVSNSVILSTEAEEKFGSVIQAAEGEMQSFATSAKHASANIQTLDNIFGSFSGIPALDEMHKLTQTNIRDTLAWKAAVFALGAALGKAAYDYFGAPIKAAMQADKERKQNEIDTASAIAKLRKDAEFIPAQIAQERREEEIQNANNVARAIHDASYAGVRAAHEFKVSMEQGAAQFERAAKTALFGNKLGSVGYGAAQLQLAGISAEKIASAMEAASAATGKMPSGKVGADMALMAERTGQSVDNIAQINDYFQRTDGVSAKVAMNMQEGLRAMADQAGIGLGNLMREVAEASKDALSYNIKSGPALAKAVAYTQSMGLNFQDVAKAGKNMVMNYKDSIKAEMQLSTLLGEQVDLSEVRAKFAAGDQKGALEALKATGLDPADMDMFQLDALQQSLGGMDIQSIQKAIKGEGAAVGDLKAGDAGAANQGFLKTTQAAEQALNAKQAQISAESAVFDAQLSGKIADAFLASAEYEKYKVAQNAAAQEAEQLSGKMKDAWLQTDAYKKSLADSMKLDFVSGLKESLMSGLAMAGGGLVSSMLFGGGKKKEKTESSGKGFFGKIGSIFSGKKESPAAGSTVAGATTTSTPATVTAGANLPGEGATVPTTAEKPGGESITPTVPENISIDNMPVPLPVTIVGGMASGETNVEVGDEKKGIFAKAGEKISNMWSGVVNWFKGIGERISNAWKGVIGWFKGIFTTVGEKIGNVWQSVTGFFSKIGDGIREKWGKVTEFFSGVGEKIKGLWNTATSFITDGIKTGWERVVGFFSGIVDTVKTFFKTKVAGMFKKGGLKSMAPGGGTVGEGGGDEGGGEEGLGGGMKALGGKGGKSLGKNLASFGKGAGQLLSSLGKGAGSLIQGILTGVAQGLMQFANPVVVLGATGLAGVIVAIGTGIAGASWILGKALPTLADGLKSFNDVDGGNLARVGLGIGAFGVGLAAMGVGAVIGGIGNLVGSLFGGGIEETIQKVEAFSKANINPEKVKANADAIIAYSKAMAMSGLGSAAAGIGNLVGSIADGLAGFFGKKPPIDQMQDFAKYDFGKDADKIKENAEVFAIFGNAMSSFKGGSGSLGGVLGDALAGFFKVKPPVDQMLEFAKYDFGPQKEKIKANAETFSIFAKAISEYKGGSAGLGGVVAEAIAGYFKVPTPIDKFREFANLELFDKEKVKSNAEAFTAFAQAMAKYEGGSAGFGAVVAEAVAGFLNVESPIDKFVAFANLPAFDVTKVKNNAEAFTAFGNAMATYSGGTDAGFFSSLGEGIASFFGAGKTDTIGDFERFSKIDATGITNVSQAIGIMSTQMAGFNTAGLETVGESLIKFVDSLDDGQSGTLSVLGPALASLGQGLTALSGVQNNPNIATIGVSLKSLIDSKVFESIYGQSAYINVFTLALNNLNTALSGGIISSLAGFVGLYQNVNLFSTALQALTNSNSLSTLVVQSQSMLQISTNLSQIEKSLASINMVTDSVLRLSSAISQLASINIASIRAIPWDRMTNFAAQQGGSIVLAKTANNNFTIEKNTAKNIEGQFKKIEEIAANNVTLLKISEAIERLLLIQTTGQKQQLQLVIDGKPVTKMIERRTDNATATTPTTNTSDIRLKEQIELIGKSELGINIYTFKYIGKEGIYQGVMAQELIGTQHESALHFDGEYYSVDYSKLDVEFIQLY